MIARSAKINLLVAVAFLAAAATAILAWQTKMPFPGYWQIGTFILIAFLLDQTSLPLRIAASGSVSFVMHMAAGVLFGGFWGALVAGSAAGISQVVEGVEARKIVFNVSQRILSVGLAVLIY